MNYLCRSSSNKYFMRNRNMVCAIPCDARCFRSSVASKDRILSRLAGWITHDNIWEELVPGNLPTPSQRPSHAL